MDSLAVSPIHRHRPKNALTPLLQRSNRLVRIFMHRHQSATVELVSVLAGLPPYHPSPTAEKCLDPFTPPFPPAYFPPLTPSPSPCPPSPPPSLSPRCFTSSRLLRCRHCPCDIPLPSHPWGATASPPQRCAGDTGSRFASPPFPRESSCPQLAPRTPCETGP